MNEAGTDSLNAALSAFGTIEGPSPVQVIGALSVVLGAILLVAWLYRRSALGGRGVSRASSVQVVGRTPIDRKSSILLVAVDGRRVLVGVTASSVSALSEWEEEPEPELTIEEARAPLPARFDSVLGRVITKLRALEEVPS